MSAADGLVLLAEDNSTDALMVRRAFTKAGLRGTLEVVDDGDKAVTYLSGQGEFADRERYPLPVLLLLDLKLPRRSGLEVLAWVRQQPDLRRLPVGFDALLEMVRSLGLYWLLLNRNPELGTAS